MRFLLPNFYVYQSSFLQEIRQRPALVQLLPHLDKTAGTMVATSVSLSDKAGPHLKMVKSRRLSVYTQDGYPCTNQNQENLGWQAFLYLSSLHLQITNL